jgi:hypothetical protein
LVVGLPLFLGVIVLINAYMVVNGIIMAITTIGLFAATVRKKNFGIRFTRASFIAFAATFFTVGALVQNLALWPSQIERHAFKSTLLQPNSAKIQEVDDAFKWWLDNRSTDFGNGLGYYGGNLTDLGKPMEDVYYRTLWSTIFASGLSAANFSSPKYYTQFQKMLIVDYFIQNMVMHWTDDSYTWDVSDHVPVPDEALSDWHFSEAWKASPTTTVLQARDDCDGIAVVTVSFIRRLIAQGNLSGEAFVSCGKSHWFTAVKVNGTTPYVFLNHWASVHVYGIYMDDNTVVLGQNIISTMEDALIVDEEARDEVLAYVEFLSVIPVEYYWLIVVAVVVAAVVICMLVVMLFGYPRDYDVAGERAHVQGIMKRYDRSPKIARPFIWLFAAKIRNPFGRRHLFYWINVTAFSGLLVAGVFTYFFTILGTALFPYATLFMYAFIFGLLFLLDRDVFVRAFKGIYKIARKRDFSLYGRAP